MWLDVLVCAPLLPIYGFPQFEDLRGKVHMLSSVRGSAPHPFDVVRDNELLAVIVMPLLYVQYQP